MISRLVNYRPPLRLANTQATAHDDILDSIQKRTYLKNFGELDR